MKYLMGRKIDWFICEGVDSYTCIDTFQIQWLTSALWTFRWETRMETWQNLRPQRQQEATVFCGWCQPFYGK